MARKSLPKSSTARLQLPLQARVACRGRTRQLDRSDRSLGACALATKCPHDPRFPNLGDRTAQRGLAGLRYSTAEELFDWPVSSAARLPCALSAVRTLRHAYTETHAYR